MKNLTGYLNDPIFRVLTEKEREQVVASAVRRPVKKGEYLVLQGDIWEYLFFIEQGSVVAEKGSFDGRTFVAATFKPGDLFWGLGFFLDNAVMPANLRVFEDGVIIQCAKRD